ncbi:MAG TPA: BACON domain-containing carbohydrate-binding protein [Vicinamibacterales bacterium]|nr:BACON domain-containing carbohydrate-binding protein [Vicinamibacterales bacterium]
MGTVTVVATDAQCGWAAISEVPWIVGFTPPSGVGGGDVHFTVAANPNDGPRQGEIVFNDTHLRITQTGAACDMQISPASQSAPAEGMSGTVVATTGSSCAWSATSNVNWIVVTSDRTTAGEGIVQYTVAANPGTMPRTGIIAIDSRVFTVTQAAK